MEERQRQGRTLQRAGQEKEVKGKEKNGRELESNTCTLGCRGTIWNLMQSPCPGAFRRDRTKNIARNCAHLECPVPGKQHTQIYIYICIKETHGKRRESKKT